MLILEGSWTHKSVLVIDRQARESGLEGAELERFCRKNYPWAMRRGWAYEAWLRAMRARFRGPAAPVTTRRELLEQHGQLRLALE